MKHKRRNIYFTSDLHFGHAKVIEYSNRPYKSVEEMNEKLISNWNSVVKNPDDVVIVVGDFSMYLKKPALSEILSKLNGQKVLVRGNHDMSAAEHMNSGFDFVCDSMTMKIANETVNISHYPYKKPKYVELYYDIMYKFFPKRFYRPRKFLGQMADDGRFLIHGHTHSKQKFNKKMIHVGADAWNYKPVPLQKIANMIDLIKKNKTEYIE